MKPTSLAKRVAQKLSKQHDDMVYMHQVREALGTKVGGLWKGWVDRTTTGFRFKVQRVDQILRDAFAKANPKTEVLSKNYGIERSQWEQQNGATTVEEHRQQWEQWVANQDFKFPVTVQIRGVGEGLAISLIVPKSK